METAVAVGPTRSVARWTALAGAVYVVLFVVGTIVLFNGSPAGDAPPAKVIQWYSDSGNRDQANIGWLLIGLGLFFLLWFIATLRRAVMSVDGEGILTAVVAIGGSVYAAVAFASVERTSASLVPATAFLTLSHTRTIASSVCWPFSM